MRSRRSAWNNYTRAVLLSMLRPALSLIALMAVSMISPTTPSSSGNIGDMKGDMRSIRDDERKDQRFAIHMSRRSMSDDSDTASRFRPSFWLNLMASKLHRIRHGGPRRQVSLNRKVGSRSLAAGDEKDPEEVQEQSEKPIEEPEEEPVEEEMEVNEDLKEDEEDVPAEDDDAEPQDVTKTPSPPLSQRKSRVVSKSQSRTSRKSRSPPIIEVTESRSKSSRISKLSRSPTKASRSQSKAASKSPSKAARSPSKSSRSPSKRSRSQSKVKRTDSSRGRGGARKPSVSRILKNKRRKHNWACRLKRFQFFITSALFRAIKIVHRSEIFDN